MAYDQAVRDRFFALLATGYSVIAAAQEIGISRKTAFDWKKGTPENGDRWREARLDRTLPAPKPIHKLGPDATRSLEDFAFWRWRYLGRRSTPWQTEAAYRMVEWLDSSETEFVVVNCPPGSGKSTLFTHDIPAWMICRDRSIRILLGSRTMRLAQQYSNRIRRLLERVRPVGAAPKQGRPEAAEGCLAVDFGRFRPEVADIWRQAEFTVTSLDQSPLEDKEPTVAAYGMDSEFLGARANLCIWDDLVVGSVLKTEDSIENQRKWWDEEGETRVEPGGLMLLQGQRMGPEDLYRYALDQKLGVGGDDDEDFDPDDDHDHADDLSGMKYRHIVYPAHFEELCTGKHSRTMAAYPESCLLDPVRIPWSGRNGLTTIMRNRAEKYAVQYQQKDVDPDTVLVKPVWVSGGIDPDTGEQHVGCWDNARGWCELPQGLASPWYSIATADPSPTKYWAIEWWVYQPASSQRFLMDLIRQPMESPEFLDWNAQLGIFSGVMQDWQTRSIELGYPISHWIVENNAAQRFMLQYEHVKRWQQQHRVAIIPHSTGRNKLDPEYGVQMIGPVWRHGLVRLPGRSRLASGLKDPGRVAALKLVAEVTKYPDGQTDDCVMAEWFLEYHLPTLSRPRAETKRLPRPSFVRSQSMSRAQSVLYGG